MMTTCGSIRAQNGLNDCAKQPDSPLPVDDRKH